MISIHGDIMAVAMQNAGFVLYSVADPLSPVRLSQEVLFFEASPNATAAAASTPYTLGVLDAKYAAMENGRHRWVLLVTDDGVSAELKVVDYVAADVAMIAPDLEPEPDLDA